MDYSPPGSSVHRISQAGIVQWVAISWSSWPRDQTRIPCNADDSLRHSLSELGFFSSPQPSSVWSHKDPKSTSQSIPSPYALILSKHMNPQVCVSSQVSSWTLDLFTQLRTGAAPRGRVQALRLEKANLTLSSTVRVPRSLTLSLFSLKLGTQALSCHPLTKLWPLSHLKSSQMC